MRVNELKNSLKTKIDGVYVLSGDDSYLKEVGVGEFKKLAGDMPDFNLVVLEGAGLSVGDVLSEMSQVPFMADRRVVVIKDWTPSGEGVVEKIQGSVSAETVLVLTYSQTPPQQFKKAFTFVDCNKLDKGEVADYIQTKCRERGYEISGATASKLGVYTSGDLARINGELNKLFAYCDRVIDDLSIEEVVSRDMEFVVYALSNAVACGNAKEAFELVDAGRGDSGRNLGMLTTLTTQFRRMLHVSLNKNMDRRDMATYLGMSDYAVGKTVSLAQKFKPAKLKAVVDRLEELEYEFKSGRIASADEALFIGVSYALNK